MNLKTTYYIRESTSVQLFCSHSSLLYYSVLVYCTKFTVSVVVVWSTCCNVRLCYVHLCLLSSNFRFYCIPVTITLYSQYNCNYNIAINAGGLASHKSRFNRIFFPTMSCKKSLGSNSPFLCMLALVFGAVKCFCVSFVSS